MPFSIAEVELYLLETRRARPEGPVRSLLVRLTTSQALEGWGEAQTQWQAAELPARRDALASVLTGRSIFEIEELLALGALRLAPLRCAVEMACWDLIGRATGQPLCRLFGGAYRPRIPVAVALEKTGPEQTARLARELAEQGFHWQTLPACGHMRQDLETVAAVREVTPERAELYFDAAGLYEPDAARELCTELEGFGLRAVLDPLSPGDLGQVASLRRQTSVRLGVWRGIHAPADMLALVRWGAADCAVVDLELVGGLSAARKCAAVGEAAGLEAALTTGPSVGIGLAAVVQLVSASPALSGCIPCRRHPLEQEILSEPLAIAEGTLPVPKAPGLGIEVDRTRVDRCQIT
ncbi:MAG: mandelate racemase/muconate lactonizing enzyme family protein [Thermoguttaceae bacterium]